MTAKQFRPGRGRPDLGADALPAEALPGPADHPPPVVVQPARRRVRRRRRRRRRPLGEPLRVLARGARGKNCYIINFINKNKNKQNMLL